MKKQLFIALICALSLASLKAITYAELNNLLAADIKESNSKHWNTGSIYQLLTRYERLEQAIREKSYHEETLSHYQRMQDAHRLSYSTNNGGKELINNPEAQKAIKEILKGDAQWLLNNKQRVQDTFRNMTPKWQKIPEEQIVLQDAQRALEMLAQDETIS